MQNLSVGGEEWFDMISMPKQPNPSWTSPVQDGFDRFNMICTNTCRCVQLVGKHDLIWLTASVQDGFGRFGMICTNTCRCVRLVGKHDLIWFQIQNNQTSPEQTPFRTDFVVLADSQQYMQMRSMCEEASLDMILISKQTNSSWTGPVQDGFGRFGTVCTNTCRCVQLVGKRDLIWF